MGLPRAIRAHGQGNLAEAELHYRRAYDQGQRDEILYQNFGALLKKIGKVDQAKLLYEEGLSRYPNHPSITRNFANLLRKECPAYATELYLKAIDLSLAESQHFDLMYSCVEDLIELLRDNGLFSWCQSLIRAALLLRQPSPLLLKNLLLVSDKAGVHNNTKHEILLAIHSLLSVAPLRDAVELDFALAAHYMNAQQLERSLESFDSALRRIRESKSISSEEAPLLQNLVDVNSWNHACTLLPLQKFNRGWALFDHGLRTPAEGQQRWQRALAKPFTSEQLPLWRGEFDSQQRILLLEEQAIGDGMMFLSLIPSLLSETRHLGLFVSPRLESIYRRSFKQEIDDKKISIYTKNDLSSKRLVSSAFDKQVPLGSICQYRFKRIEDYAPRVPILMADQDLSQKLRHDYLNHSNQVERLVGVSWRGGGRGARIKQKSLDTKLFGDLMKENPGIRFIDLQYGETSDQIKNWQGQGIDILKDPRINALKDMDRWLAQVQACDAVLSVANTTIHGSGGLNIPTQCLLSIYSDWRWLIDPEVMRSYWYPSVGIARESKDTHASWSHAFKLVSDWLKCGCPMPSGVIQPPMQ